LGIPAPKRSEGVARRARACPGEDVKND